MTISRRLLLAGGAALAIAPRVLAAPAGSLDAVGQTKGLRFGSAIGMGQYPDARYRALIEAECGVIAQDSGLAIVAALGSFQPDTAMLRAGVARDGVVVPELVRQIRATVGTRHGEFVHFGATSQDVVDTSLVLRLRQAVDHLGLLLDENVVRLTRLEQAFGHRALMAMTRMQPAIEVTVADRIAAWRLRALGLKPGDRILTWSPSTPALPAAYFGAMAARLWYVLRAHGHDVLIGSRTPRDAFVSNADACRPCDVVFLSVPPAHVEAMARELGPLLAGKIAVSVATAVVFRDGRPTADPGPVSIAEAMAAGAPGARVVSGFHTVSAKGLADVDHDLNDDVLLCGDDAEAKDVVAQLAGQVVSGRVVDAGPLEVSRWLETVTAVLLNVNRRYRAHTGIKITGLP